MFISPDAERRYRERSTHRNDIENRIASGAPIEDLDSKARVDKRKARLAAAAYATNDPELLERTLGANDLMPVNYLDKARTVSRSICRISIEGAKQRPSGYATGFLIAPGILITNHHVFPDKATAAASVAEFNFELSVTNQPTPVATFALEADRLFWNDDHLDVAVVGIASRSDEGRALSDFGYLPLIASEGKIVVGECVSIIQHPAGRPKEIAIRENQLVDVLDEFLQYKTDTEPGSSGSPVFNDQWELVALHHSGVPERDAAGNIKGWVANEGVRVSRLAAWMNTLGSTDLTRTIMARPDAAPAQPVITPEASLVAPALAQPFSVTITFGSGQPAVAVSTPFAAPAGATADTTEAVSIDPDYSNRKGYDPAFLGVNVPLPQLADELRKLAAKNVKAADGTDPLVLPYNHYSVVLNGQRKIPFFTAVNIDGRRWVDLKRERDAWIFDPRVPREYQAGADIYQNNPLDKGHLVRRLDPAWGDSPALAKVANDDTFHYTNCSPQHHEFNAGATLWAGLEDYILGNASNQKFRVNVFSGPVLRKTDPQYRGIQLPLEFWKVVTMLHADGSLSATAYLLSQAALIDAMPNEDFSFGAYKTFQVPVRRIATMTGLDFGDLPKHDPLDTGTAEADATVKPFETYGDVTL